MFCLGMAKTQIFQENIAKEQDGDQKQIKKRFYYYLQIKTFFFSHTNVIIHTILRGRRDPMKGDGKPQASGKGYSPFSSTPSMPWYPGSLNTSHLEEHTHHI